MTAIIPLLLILTFSWFVTRIATVALVHTGLSRETAEFQARSAFTGVGYTTHEAESIVNHPVRRRIAMILMLLGNAGIVSAVATLLLTFIDTRPGAMLLRYRLLILALGVLLLLLLASSRWVDKWLSRVISWALDRWTDLDVRDYAALLHLADNHQIQEMNVSADDWLAGKTLAQVALSDEGVVVIGIQRPDGSYVAAPVGGTPMEVGDVALVYGQDAALRELDQRCVGECGDRAHREAVERQRQILAAERSRDAERHSHP